MADRPAPGRPGRPERPLVIGVGARRGAAPGGLEALARNTLQQAGLAAEDVGTVVTLETRAVEPALRALAGVLDAELRGLDAAELAQHADSAPSGGSQVVAAAVGTSSVAEAAVLAVGARVLVPRVRGDGLTLAVGTLDTDPVPGEIDLRHHGDAEIGPGLVNLAVNVRQGAPPAWLRDRLRAAVDDLAAYPDARPATAAVARRHGVAAGRVLLTAGGAEGFVLLARALRPRRAVVIHPQFTEPEAALRAAGRPVGRVLLPPPFTLDPALVPDDADLVVVGNPNNPTSVLHPAEVLAGLAKPGRVLVVDEAFMDAVPGEPESLVAADLPGLVVLRSLTKTWGLAGLRIGYLAGDPAVLAACADAQPLWSVGTLALAAAEACTEPAAISEAAAWARDVGRDREHLVAALSGVPGVEVVPDARAPFLLLRVPDAAGVRERLRSAGWAARRGDTFPGLGRDWLRVAVRDRATSDAFAGALAGALADLAPDRTMSLEVVQ